MKPSQNEMPGPFFFNDHNKTFYTTIIDHMAVAVYVCDTQGRIIYYNRLAADLWGRSPRLNEELWSGAWKMYRTNGSELSHNSSPMALTLKEAQPAGDEEIVIERP